MGAPAARDWRRQAWTAGAGPAPPCQRGQCRGVPSLLLQQLLLLLLLALVSPRAGGEAVGETHTPRRRHRVVITRSIVDSHPHGGNRSCGNEAAVRSFLPASFRQEDSNKHIHLLLAVSDNQLAHLLNFLAIAFTFRFLPNPRVLIHFACHGHLTKLFVERYLESECQPRPQRHSSNNETAWQRIIKDRLGGFLDIVRSLDETDAGAMTFDLDSVWIRNMVSVMDSFNQNYDFIAQGGMREGKWKGRVGVNFGGVFVKNSPGGRALAAAARDELNSGLELEMPDQDYVSQALFERGKATQASLPEFAFTKSSLYSNVHCSYYPDTCTHVASGVNGTFTLDSGNSTSLAQGSYLLLPQLVAPTDCSHVCSTSTLLFQHCGIAKCSLVDESLATPPTSTETEPLCSSIVEFIVTTKLISAIAKQIPPPQKFKQHHASFDSARMSHMITQVEKFVDSKRAEALCSAYSRVCKATTEGFVISED